MENFFFRGKLPNFLGFDSPEIPLKGSRCSIHQSNIHKNYGQSKVLAPSFRYISKIGPEYNSILAGGISDRRFDKSYLSEFKDWSEAKLKKISRPS